MVKRTYTVEQAVAFGEVNDADAYRLQEVARVLHPKIEPLQVADPIGVVAHPDVILRDRLLPDLIDVGTFEVTVKSHFLRDAVQRDLVALRVRNVRGIGGCSVLGPICVDRCL